MIGFFFVLLRAHSCLGEVLSGFVLRSQQHTGDRQYTGFWSIVLTALPILVACLVAVSRVADHHHFLHDIIIGGLIGATSAFVCYRPLFKSRPQGTQEQEDESLLLERLNEAV